MLSKNLEMSLHRALNIARDYFHEYATLEHLLLSLSKDPDAYPVMEGCGLDIELLQKKLEKYLREELSALITTNREVEPKPTAGFQRVIHRAAINVHKSGKNEVTGAEVLAAFFSDDEKASYAYYFLNEQKVSFVDVDNFIHHGVIRYNTYGQDSDDESPSEKNTKIEKVYYRI